MNKRSDHIPRVNRNVLPKDEIYTIDVETGKTVAKVVWCAFHKKHEDVRAFYGESEPKKKSKYQLRNMCIIGWDLVKGKVKPDPQPPSSTLELFLG